MIEMIGSWLRSLYAAFIKKQKDEGAKEERDAETERQVEAKRRADEVLAQPRTADDTADRLRRGDF